MRDNQQRLFKTRIRLFGLHVTDMISLINRFISNLSAGQRFLAFVLILAFAVALVGFAVGGWTTGIPIGILILVVLWLTKPVWKPPESSNIQIALSSLAVISGTALAILGRTPEGKPVLKFLLGLLNLQASSSEQSSPADHWISALVVAFTLTGVFIVNWSFRDRSAMRKHPKPLDKEFPQQDYRQQLKRFSEILLSRLNTLDEETKWDDYFFAPLDAEVEILSGRRSKRRVMDLMRALREDRTSRIILILGDPGAGKSIALRRLAKELLREIHNTGRVPVYVNLKEWTTNRSWTADAPPTIQEFRGFILQTLKAQNLFADQFLSTYFDSMVDRGRFFFLLDSFDEIPGVLDVSEASTVIQQLSALITEFFVGQEGGRGIVASRVYRRPKFNRVDSATFEIRPFSDMRIHEALLKSSKLQQSTIEELFRSRTELIPVARNPFSAALIRMYAETHGGDLPVSQLEMYESYIRHRLEGSREQTEQLHLSIDEVIAGARDIAWCMFETADIGLEAAVTRLAEILPKIKVVSITSILRYAGLARLSGGTDARFSFVHRRINEYFVAKRLLDSPDSIVLDVIPSDSRYRDALALYCEVAAASSAKTIADFCWRKVNESIGAADIEGHQRAVHCLRFLRDAFRARPECLSFLPELAAYIHDRIHAANDILSAKIALEATGLLPDELAEPILVDALGLADPWISETALHSCRHRKEIGADLKLHLLTYLLNLTPPSFLIRYQELMFSLSLSDAFSSLQHYCKARYIELRFLIPASVTTILISPALVLFAGMQYALVRIVILNRLTPGSFRRLFITSRIYMFITLVTLAFVSTRHPLRPSISGKFIMRIWTNPLSYAPRMEFWLIVVLCVCICPWLDGFLYLEQIEWKNMISLKFIYENKVKIATLVISGIGVILVIILLNLAEKYIKFMPTLLAGAGIIFVLYRIRTVIAYSWKDRKIFLQATQSIAADRAAIGQEFSSFCTRWYRLRYVEWLRDRQIHPTGFWPTGRPYFRNDPASTMLAQLDERWLGLDI